jgi:hypothetical protein
LILVILPAWTIHASPSLIGKSETQVLKQHGNPMGIMELGEKRILLFQDVTVTLKEKRVVDADFHNTTSKSTHTLRPLNENTPVSRTESLKKESSESPEYPVMDEARPLTESTDNPSFNSKIIIFENTNRRNFHGSRSHVLQKNLAEVQQGKKVILPDIDPKTSEFKGYKAVDRKIFEEYGGPETSRMEIKKTERQKQDSKNQNYKK